MVGLAMLLTGCGLFSDATETEAGPTCGDQDWCYDEDEYIEGSYDPAIARLYCTVTDLRQRVTHGQLELNEFPRWVNRDYRNNAPIIVDMASIATTEFGQREQELVLHFEDTSQPIDRKQARTCADELTQRDIEATDGKRKAG
ncbi:MAG: hypothetical protein L0H93_19720 [Nocardioides sp.]|nr:hypothetical protein [Nocardioides sp.]